MITSKNMERNSPWSAALPERLSFDEIHVWRASLLPVDEEYSWFVSLLSEGEMARVERLYFEEDTVRFVIAHGVLRSLLAFYLKRRPKEIEFETEKKGRPRIKNPQTEFDIRFNMSHSGDLGLFAFSLEHDAGIDLELIRHNVDVDSVSQRFFSVNEIKNLNSTSGLQKTELFFQYWTRKEALVKGIGEGVFFPLEKCDVASMAGGELSPFVLYDESERRSWFGVDICPDVRYCGALACQGRNWVVRSLNYSFESLKT